MPLVKLTISEDPIEVHESEIPILEGQALLEKVLDPAPAGGKPGNATPPAGGKPEGSE